ncbi:MAG TPA: tripartite tricarboxylate transporter substrate binding protein [Burkholderiales bacterium]|nr:tripartite tricarboxylate transporter substrate binding protein [Burkholderiales bacterium]
MAAAQDYPARPIRIITGSPGSTSDLAARFIGQKLTEAWGQQAVVDNRPGAGGIIGVEIASKAAPDGYTLVVGHVGTHASAQALFKNLAYDPVKDFAPLSNVVNVAIALVVHPSVPAASLKEFVAYAQAKAGGVNYGSPGGGTSGNLTGELFNLVTKARMQHVPYKGAGFALTGVVAGETQASFLSTATAAAHIRAGRLRALAVIRKTRFPGLPEVPSAAEAGYPELDANAWFGLFAPARTPRTIVAKLNREIVRVLEHKENRELLLKQGAEAAPTSPEAFGAYVRSEIEKWTRVIRESGLTAK